MIENILRHILLEAILPYLNWIIITIVTFVLFKYWCSEKCSSSSFIPPPILDGFPIVGKAPHVFKWSWNIKGVPLVVYSMQCALGISLKYNLSKEGIFAFKYGTGYLVNFYKAKSMEALLSSTTNIEKPFFYDFSKQWLGTGLLTSKGNHWRKSRKMLTPTFHFKSLESVQPIMYEKSKIMIDILKEKEGNFFHLEDVISLYTIDVICSTALGLNLNCQREEKNPYIQAFKRVINPLLWTDWSFKLSSSGKEFYKCLDIIDRNVRQIITEKKEALQDDPLVPDFNLEDHKGKLGFLDMLVLQHLHDPESISEDDIRYELNTFMFGGQDTTASALVWCLFLLGNFPEEQEILYEEVTQILGLDLKREITTNDVKKMTYLDCVLKESQRIYPSAPVFARVLTEDLVVGKYLVQKGSVCIIFTAALHMDPDVFPIPERFIPERFTPENSKGRNPFAYVPFSAGPRNCIGQKFAILEEKTALANIIRNFKIVSKDHLDQIPVSQETVSRPGRKVFVKCVPRTK